MKVTCCQLDIVWEDKPANHAKVRRLLESAAPSEGSLVILPEMFATGFSMNVEAIAEGSSRQTESFLAQMAAKYRVFMMGGVVNRSADGNSRGRNECVIFSPQGSELERYAKLHPFTFGGESQHYEGGRGIRVLSVNEFSVAPFICYDLRFPEIFRAAVRRGANLLTVIANWPAPREEHWTTLLKARAIENQSYVIGVNRCGSDPRLKYSGRSIIFDPRGRIVAEAGDDERTLSAELDVNPLIEYRREFPVLEDIRADLETAEVNMSRS